jgi:anti-sigma-K factor RskA
MKNHWHEQIQRYVNGQSSAEEAASLQSALYEDAELRALYLDYMNLDAALGAAAEMATTVLANGTGGIATFPRSAARLLPHYWRWLAATAACAALVAFLALPIHRNSPRVRPEVFTAISSTQSAIARLSYKPASTLPAWISPTASMLDEPRLPE